MSYFDDWQKLERLEGENEYLHEQVRTLLAHQSEKPRTDFLILKEGRPDRRPAHETAASRVLLTDEVVAQSEMEAFDHAARRMKRQIEAIAKSRAPLDFIWRLTMERDYRRSAA